MKHSVVTIRPKQIEDIGFVPNIDKGVKNLGGLAALVGGIIAATSRSPLQKLAGVGVAVIGGTMYFKKTEEKGDSKGVDDVKLDQSKVNKFNVQSFVSRFESARIDDNYKASAICTDEASCHKMLSDFLALDNDNFKAVCNFWKNKHNVTLRKDLNGWKVKKAALSIYQTSKSIELKTKITQRMNDLFIP